jgi:peroxiredoxin
VPDKTPVQGTPGGEKVVGLSVEQRAPNFELPDEQGRPWVLSERLAVGPVVLVFYRGDW